MKKLSKEAFDRIKADFDYAKTYTNGRMLPEKTLELFRHISALEEELAEKDAEISRLTDKVEAADEVVVKVLMYVNYNRPESPEGNRADEKLAEAITAYEKIGG